MQPSISECDYRELWARYQRQPCPVISDRSQVYIWGTGSFGQSVYRVLRDAKVTVAGFVETKPSNSRLLDIPIVPLDTYTPSESDVVTIAIHNRETPLDGLADTLHRHGVQHALFPWDIARLYPAQLGWKYWLSSPDEIIANRDRIVRLHERLADDESKRCLYRIVAFRLGLEIEYASFKHDEIQYFNYLILDALPQRPIRYVDGGAFDGGSLDELMLYRSVAQAFLFEPDQRNFRLLTERLRDCPFPIVRLPLGLSDRYRIESFSGNQGEGCAISTSGTDYVACASLDEVLGRTEVDFIKLDVEGAEIAALSGASDILRASRPVLAISLYHMPDHLWAIPETIDRIQSGYKFYIRQHCANSFDSVLYAISA